MKAAVISGVGTPEVIAVLEMPERAPGADEIRVEVAAAAINPVDLKTRSGFLNLKLTYPSILGWDVSGTVTEVGSDVAGFAVGDKVLAMVAQPTRPQGTYARFVTAPANLFTAAPHSISLEQAAAIPLAGLTACQAISALGLHDGARILVTGAAGAVGRIAVQLLLRAGHQVGALARESDKRDLLSLGVSEFTSDPAPRPEWDAVLDTAGLASSISAVVGGGKFVSIDDNQQPEPQRGITPRKSYVQENAAQLAEIVAAVDSDEVSVPIHRRYPLTEIVQAHHDFEAGGIRGKLLVIP